MSQPMQDDREFAKPMFKDPSDPHSPMMYELCWEQDKPGFGTACDRIGGHKGRHSWQAEPAELDETPVLMQKLIESLRETKKRDDETIAGVLTLAREWLSSLPINLPINEAGRMVMAALGGETPRWETHVLIDRATIECVLLDHADELDTENDDTVDADLAELAHRYRELTGFDARKVRDSVTRWRGSALWRANPANQVSDGFGSTWVKCSPGCDLHVVRPGKVQCNCEGR